MDSEPREPNRFQYPSHPTLLTLQRTFCVAMKISSHLLSNGSRVTTELLPSPSSPSLTVNVEVEMFHFKPLKLEFLSQDFGEILIPNAVITRVQVQDHLHLSSLGLFDLTLSFST